MTGLSRLAPLRLIAAGALGVVASWIVAVLFNARFIESIAQPGVARALAADAFLAEAVLVILVAPLAGIALPRHTRAVVTAGVTFLLLSLAVALVFSTQTSYPVSLVMRGHALLALVSASLLALGALSKSVMRSDLDAAGAAATIAIVAASAILVGGPRTAHLSERAIDTALLANPLIAITSAAEIDLLRSEMFYTLAPVSHRRFTYPAWPSTAGAYGTVALCAFAFTFFRTRQKGSTE